MTMHDQNMYRKAAEALVDAATVCLSADGTLMLHPMLRDHLIEEVVANPSATASLFKDNFIEEFLKEVVVQSNRLS